MPKCSRRLEFLFIEIQSTKIFGYRTVKDWVSSGGFPEDAVHRQQQGCSLRWIVLRERKFYLAADENSKPRTVNPMDLAIINA